MDVVVEKKKKQYPALLKNKYLLVSIALITLVVAVLSSGNGVGVEKESLVLSTIKKGNLVVNIDGFGILESSKPQLITTLVRSTVKEIVLKPGANVSADSVIAILANPELQQEYVSALQAVEQAKINLEKVEVDNKRELLNEEASIAQLISELETARLNREAEESLVKKGIVPYLQFKRTELTEKQLEKRIALMNTRIAQLKQVQEASVRIEHQLILAEEGKLNVAKKRLESLKVKAGINGVLQRLSVEVGQSLVEGQEIALIGSVDDLLATIKVPQSQAQNIVVDQDVIIDTRKIKIDGKVARIDPIVEDNSVNIEVTFPMENLTDLRPYQRVEASIIVDVLNNVNYMDRPRGVMENTSKRLYKVSSDFNSASSTLLSFGRRSGRYIEVISGSSAGDTFVVSDVNQTDETISIN